MLKKFLVASPSSAGITAVTVLVAAHSTHPLIVFLIGALVAFVVTLVVLLIFFGKPYEPQEF